MIHYLNNQVDLLLVAKIDPNAHRVDINSLRQQQAKGNEFMPDDGDGEVQVIPDSSLN